MKKKLLLALSLAGLTSLGAHAQLPSCGATMTKSGTGMTRTYTAASPNATNPQYSFSAYSNGQGYVATGSTNPFVVTYTQPGYYNVGVSVNASNCVDSVYVMDTVVGTLNCGTLTHSMYPSGSGASFNFYLYGAHGSSFPYYTRTTNYSYGDGTTGTSNSHTYTTSGTYLVTATTTFSSSNYGTCSVTDTVSVTANVGGSTTFSCANVNAAFAFSVTGATATFSNNSTNSNTSSSTVSYTWNFGDGSSPMTTTAPSFGHTYAASGQYCVTMVATWMANGMVLCRDSARQCFPVTVTPAPNVITASANWDSSVNAAGATVRLWLIEYDSLSQKLTAIDSADVPCMANVPYVVHNFVNQPAGAYRVKAHMMNQPSSWTTGYLPTYATTAYFWQNATVVNHGTGTDYSNVWLLQGTPFNGQGFIGGLITQGANKGAAIGDPIVGLNVYLLDAMNNPVAATKTDVNGNYSFTNVPVGTYSVYPEALNFATTAFTNLQITASVNSLTGKDFKYEPGMEKINPVPQSVINTVAGEVAVFPNPAKDVLTIQFAQAPEKGAVLRLLNLNGQVVRTEAATQAIQQMNVSGLAAGTYLLQVPGTSTTYRIAVQK